MNRRKFLRAVGVGAASLAVPYIRRAAAQPRKPNIVFILADDLGYGHLGCYGQEKILTPNIDRLAAEGMRFTQFYAGYTVCAPSRSVLMTGLHTGHTPVRTNGGGASLWDDEVTVAEVLKQAGYATGGFGKWGLGMGGTPGVPYKQGFDEFYGYYHQVHAHFYYPFWIWHNDQKMLLPGNDNGKREQYVPDVLHEKAVEFIRTQAKRGRPFFCYIPTTIPHVELVVPEDSERPYRGKFPKITINDPRTGYIGSDDAYATYAGMVSRMDGNVGHILEVLRELGIEENTVVFFSSDNGPQLGPWKPLCDFFRGAGPLRGGKGGLYEGGIRVPFIARWPGKIKPGSVSEHIGGFQDIMPTLAELAGVAPPKNDGLSIVPTLLGQPERQREHDYLYWNTAGPQGPTAVRMGRWKGVKQRRKPWELYDLDADIGETKDIAAEHPDIVAKMETIAQQAYTPPRPRPEPPAGAKRPRITDYVRGPRVTKKNAR